MSTTTIAILPVNHEHDDLRVCNATLYGTLVGLALTIKECLRLRIGG